MNSIPRQKLPVHCCDSFESPVHGNPLNAGEGESHNLVLCIVPDPQDELQDDHVDQHPQLPFTVRFYISYSCKMYI